MYVQTLLDSLQLIYKRAVFKNVKHTWKAFFRRKGIFRLCPRVYLAVTFRHFNQLPIFPPVRPSVTSLDKLRWRLPHIWSRGRNVRACAATGQARWDRKKESDRSAFDWCRRWKCNWRYTRGGGGLGHGGAHVDRRHVEAGAGTAQRDLCENGYGVRQAQVQYIPLFH